MELLAFGLGCLVTIWWKSKPDEGTFKGHVNRTVNKIFRNEAKEEEVLDVRLSQSEVIDDELKDLLLEYMIDQIKQGKVKIVEDDK